MIKLVKNLLLLQLNLFLLVIIFRFILTSLISINYQNFSFYQAYNLRLIYNSQLLQTRINQTQNLNLIAQWAKNHGFHDVTSFSQLPSSVSLAQYSKQQ